MNMQDIAVVCIQLYNNNNNNKSEIGVMWLPLLYSARWCFDYCWKCNNQEYSYHNNCQNALDLNVCLATVEKQRLPPVCVHMGYKRQRLVLTLSSLSTPVPGC